MSGRLLLPVFLLLAACATTPPAPQAVAIQPPAAEPAPATSLAMARVRPALPANAGAALAAFRASCPALLKRSDRSGLARPEDWAAACAAAAAPGARPADVFGGQLGGLALAGGKGFATGYFEPEIAASRTRAPGYQAPFYRRPADLVEADLGAFRPEWKGRTLRGQLAGQKLSPYPDRAAIAAGALAGRGLELAFAADANEAFFLEIQGSGRLRLPDGSVMRIGYDSQNGRDYVAIGRVLRDRGALPAGGVSMESILGWLRAHPADAPAVRAANPSQIFFRELTGLTPEQGPPGAMGVPLTPMVSAAADPAFTPLGAPLIITLPGQPPLLQVAQDTGGAIRGAGRIDLFKGPGKLGAAAAGALASPADVVLLLPIAAIDRLLGQP